MICEGVVILSHEKDIIMRMRMLMILGLTIVRTYELFLSILGCYFSLICKIFRSGVGKYLFSRH
jgi:hypothetical protein